VTDREGRRFAAAIPPDLLQPYREGKVPPEALLLIPPDVLRYVPDPKDYVAVVDDYYQLRATGRPIDQIFVANRAPAKGAEAKDAEGGKAPMNTIGLGKNSDDALKRNLQALRNHVPAGLLRPFGCRETMEGISNPRAMPPGPGVSP
jgi:hypothetical protein